MVAGSLPSHAQGSSETLRYGASQPTTLQAMAPAMGTPEMVHPEFPGGDAALIQFLGQTLRYPADAYKEGVEGRVVVSFWIDEKGHPYGFGLLQPLHPSLDAEAMRALKLMPNWTPGSREGRSTPMVVHVPVVFRRPGGSASNQ